MTKTITFLGLLLFLQLFVISLSNNLLTNTTGPTLSGTYSVGGSGADYASISNAVNALVTCGISGSVVFNIAPGTYTGGVTIPPISGVSSSNTITFDGQNSSLVTVTYTGTNPHAVFFLNGADRITLTNMTIENMGSTDSWGVRLANTANRNVISNNIFLMDTLATIDAVAICASSSATDEFGEGNNANRTIVINNTVIGGSRSIHFEGINSSLNTFNEFIDNDLMKAYETGIFLDDQDYPIISGNTIQDLKNNTADGIRTFDVMHFSIEENTIVAPDWGISVADGNFEFTPVVRASVVNNMVRSEDDYGIFLDDINQVDIFHNTSYGDPGIRINDFSSVDIRNNIFVSNNDFAFEADESANSETVDYNIYQSGNTNLAKNGTSLYPTLAAWQSASSSLNSNSWEGDPGFISGTDLHVQLVLANDVGDNSVGITVDIDGDTRPLSPATTVDIGADEYLPLNPDAGVSALLNPVIPFSPGSQTIEVEIVNYGVPPISSVDIVWQVNGATQPTTTYTTPLAPGANATVNLGTYNFPGGVLDMRFWTESPNGLSDEDLLNDTLAIATCAGLIGNYSIGGSGADFANIAEAVDTLVACGVSGPTIFNLSSGNYTGGLILPEIAGSSATNTITFDGGNSSNVTVSYTGTNPHAVFLFDGADHVTLTNMTIENTGVIDSWGVRLSNESNHNTFSNNVFLMNLNPTEDVVGIVASVSPTDEAIEGNNANYTLVTNNEFIGGIRSIRFEGSASNLNVSNQFIGNDMSQADETGIFLDEQDSVLVMGNYIHDMLNSGSDGIRTFDLTHYTIQENIVFVQDWGIFVGDGNVASTTTGRSQVLNNMVHSFGDYGLYLDNNIDVDVFHNTFYGEPGIRIKDYSNLDIRNNIFVSDNDFAFEADVSVSGFGLTIDYNLYDADNPNLVKVGPTLYLDLPAWKAAFPALNVNSVQGNPGFISSTDLHVQMGTANNVGTNSVGVSVDIDGDSRPMAPSNTVDIGADEFTPIPADVGIISLVNPEIPVDSPIHIVEVEIQNFGSINLFDPTVAWEVNGMTQASQTFNISIPPGNSTVVMLDTIPFPPGPTELVFWVDNPNGLADANPLNDTLTVSTCVGLTDTFSIGGIGADFANIDEAIDTLLACGVSGPLVFNLAPGTYNGGIIIPEISGTSAINTITFDGIDSSMVTVSYAGTNPRAVFLLDGADHIILRNMTIEHTGSSNAWGVRLTDQADHNVISNNVFLMDITVTNDVVAILASSSPTNQFGEGNNANYNQVMNNAVIGGNRSIHFEGISSQLNVGNQIINNDLSLAFRAGIYLDDQDSSMIIGNNIHDLRQGSGDGIVSFDMMHYRIEENTIVVPDLGISISDGNDNFTPLGRASLINNMIRSFNGFGIDLEDNSEVDIFHNTSYGEPGIRINGFSDLDIRNNIFYSDSDAAFQADQGVNSEVIDYNLYFSSGTNLITVNSTSYPNLPAWQAATSALNANSVEGNPGFVSGTDLHAQLLSPHDAGDNTAGVIVDIDGEIRPSTSSNPVDMGADEYTPSDADVGVVSLISPAPPLTPGTYPVEVKIQNFGVPPVDSIRIRWRINGMNQSSGTYSTTLASGATANIMLGTYNFPATPTDIQFWTRILDGQNDDQKSNDTLNITTCLGLSGGYTIGGSGADYATLSDAVDALRFCGLSGPVVFTMAPGTYTGGFIINPIPGATDINTVTIDGVDPSLVTVSYTGTDPNAVFRLNGVDYLTLTNMTIVNPGTAESWGIRFTNTANHNTISNNVIIMDSTATDNVVPIGASSSPIDEFLEGNNANFNLILNNTVIGGSRSIHFEGLPANFNTGNKIIGNTLRKAYHEGIHVDDLDTLELVGNDIRELRRPDAVGIYATDLRSFDIGRNATVVPHWGIYVTRANTTLSGSGRSLVANNMARSFNTYGIYLDDVRKINVYHNTAYGESGFRMKDFSNIDIRNNIFFSDGDVAFESDDPVDQITIDYNLYNTGGPNMIMIDSVLYPDLAAWQTVSPTHNINSLVDDPGFYSGTDLHIQIESVHDEGDNNAGITVDLDGDPRPLAPTNKVDIGADEYIPINVDAGIPELISPTNPLTPGTYSVDARVRNYDDDDINTIDIVWQVNGVLQPTVTYSTTIPAGDSETVPLGSITFPSTPTDLKMWTNMPNGLRDINLPNDTLEITICVGMSGNFNVGGAGADFATLTEAVDSLLLCGIAGPVVFTLAPGTYNEGVTISEILGASATNTLTIDGVDPSLVTVTHNGSSPNATFRMGRAKYVTLTNMTIESTRDESAWGIRMSSLCDYITISNNVFRMDTSATSNVAAIAATNSPVNESGSGNNTNNTLITNNIIIGGSTGISLYGASFNFNDNNQIIGNDISQVNGTGIKLNFQESPIVSNNQIRPLENAVFVDGILGFDLLYYSIEENDIVVPRNGIFLSGGNDVSTPTSRSTLINNMVRAITGLGIYLENNHDLDVFHNTSYGEPAMLMTIFSGMDIRNNIFFSRIEAAFDAGQSVNSETIDYNVYYSDYNSLAIVGSNFYSNLNAWKNASPGLNVNSVEGDPGFLSPTDLHLQLVIANDVGDNSIGINVDIDGEARPIAPSLTVDIGADEYSPDITDAGVASMISPALPLTPGNQAIEIEVLNSGTNDINSINIDWELNGSPQAGTSYTTTILPGASATVNLGNYTFPSSPTNLKFWTDSPNGEPDIYSPNDTLELTVCVGMEGSYSIGGAGADYASISEAVDSLSVCGIDGPVFFTLAPGTYNEGVIIPQISGASAVRTITFDGVHPDSVTVSHNGSSPNAVFRLQGADHVTLTNMTIENTGVTDAWGVRLTNAANRNTISHNVFLMDPDASTDVIAIAATNSPTNGSVPGNTANSTLVSNNVVIGGSTGIGFTGNVNNLSDDNQFIDNDVSLVYEAGIALVHQDDPVVIGNFIHDVQNTVFTDGITGENLMHYTLEENSIIVPRNGIFISGGNDAFSPLERASIVNNMVRAVDGSGISLEDNNEVDLFHNTAYGEPGMVLRDFSGLDMRNNIFVSSIDVAFEADEELGENLIDYNIYESDNSSLSIIGSSSYNDLAAWQYASPVHNEHSREGDPGFVSSTDLHVQRSLANDVGDTTVNVIIDIDGEDRPMLPSTIVDIGADEFFPTIIDGNEDLLPGLSAWAVYPNPNQGWFQIEATLDRPMEFAFSLHTVQGKQVYRKSLGKLSGSFRETLDMQNLSTGVYFLRIRAGNRALNHKIVITD